MKKIISLLIAFSSIFSAFALTISGVVIEANSKDPLIGASVNIKGTSKGTSTDIDGKYTIVANKGDILVFSYLGFKSVEHTIKEDTILNIILFEDSNMLLNEVVISAKRIERKISNSSYSITYFSSPILQKGTSSNQNTEEYAPVSESKFIPVKTKPLSTFSIDVDKASYSVVRSKLLDNVLPTSDMVRIEEMVNYFDYNYEIPSDGKPFKINTEITTCPWNTEHQIVRIGIKGFEVKNENIPPMRLTFLIDVSGSMSDLNKLPYVKKSLQMLVEKLRPEDEIAIVTYSNGISTPLKPTSGKNKSEIIDIIQSLYTSGGTNGSKGIQQAYDVASKMYIKEGVNRVILCTDGDFNIGISEPRELENYISEKKDNGIFLTVLGFGMGNYKDNRLEILADKGNGNYGYIDNLLEAKKLLINEMGGTLLTIAKDVKIQVEFNPIQVKAYRLVGYEDRLLADEDFNDDQKDAGELGAGHTVTALYEIVPANSKEKLENIDNLKYQKTEFTTEALSSNEIMTVKIRYKEPDAKESQQLVKAVTDLDLLKTPSLEMLWATTVAEFGLLLKNSEFKGDATYSKLLLKAKAAKGNDEDGYKAEMIRLIELAELLQLK